MWCLGSWFTGGLGRTKLTVGSDDLKALLECKQFYDSVTQLVPTGVSLQMCLGFVGFVQPKLASSYTPLALQGQPGGHPSA